MPLAIPRSPPLEDEMQSSAASMVASESSEMVVVVGEATGGVGGERKRKKTLGRRKIDIKPIKSKDAKHVCFSKRREGVYKKATELCALTGAKVAVLVHSPAGKPYSYGHPSVPAVADRYLNRDDPASASLLAEACDAPPPPQAMYEFDGEQGRLLELIGAEARRKGALDAAARAAGVWTDADAKEAELPDLVAMLAALERVRDEVPAAAAEHEMRIQYAAAGGASDACYYGFDDLVGDGGAFVLDYGGGANSSGSSGGGGGGHQKQAAAAAMDAQQMTLMVAGNAAAHAGHAPHRFAQMLLPPRDLPPAPAPLAFNYGSDHNNHFTGYEGYAYDDLGDGGCHGAAYYEMEGSYFEATTATCNFFIE